MKVWHPDRFGGDPRLQKKAQEKLKEINEAYEAVKNYMVLFRKKTPDRGSASVTAQTGSGQQKAPVSDADTLVERLKSKKKGPLPANDIKKVAQAIASMLREGRKRR